MTAAAWALEDAQAPTANVGGRLGEVARAVVAELHQLGAPRPEVRLLKSSVVIASLPEERYGLSVDRRGVVRAWAMVESVTFYQGDERWRLRGTDVAVVVRELGLRAGFG